MYPVIDGGPGITALTSTTTGHGNLFFLGSLKEKNNSTCCSKKPHGPDRLLLSLSTIGNTTKWPEKTAEAAAVEEEEEINEH